MCFFSELEGYKRYIGIDAALPEYIKTTGVTSDDVSIDMWLSDKFEEPKFSEQLRSHVLI